MEPFHKWPLFAAHILGLRPRRKGASSTIRMAISIFFTASIGVGCVLEAALNWHGIETLTKVIPSFTPVIQILAKSFVFVLKRRSVDAIVDKLDAFVSVAGEAGDIAEEKRSARIYLSLYASMIYISGIIYNSLPYFARSLPYACYRPGLFEDDLFYNVAYLWQFFSGFFVMVNVAFAFDLFLLGKMAYVYLELRVVENAVLGLGRRDVEVEAAFGEVVRHHGFVLAFIGDINGLYSNMLLLQFLSSFLAICHGTFIFVTSGNYVEFASFVGSYLTQIFIYCFCGVLVVEETKRVGMSLYEARWWIDRVKMRKDVALVMQRSQKGTRITVGNVATLNLESFTNVIKMSYSMFALLQTMSEKK